MSSFIFNVGIKFKNKIFRFALKKENVWLDKGWYKIIGRFYWCIVDLNLPHES